MNHVVKSVLKFFAFLSIGAIILFFVYRSNQSAYELDCALKSIAIEDCSLMKKIFTDFRSVKVSWIVIIIVLFMISNIFRALRWDMMLESLGYHARKSNLFFTIMLGYFANLGIPRSGEVIRAASLSKYENIPVEKVMGTIVLDRIMDVVCLLIVVAIAIILEGKRIWQYLSEHAVLPGSNLLSNPQFYLIAIIGVVLIALIYIKRDLLLQSKIGLKIQSMLQGFYAGIMSVRNLQSPVSFILYSAGIWLMYYLMTYLCFFAFEPTSELGPIAGLTIFIFGTLGIVVPSPGGMGSYHYLVTEGLMFYGISSTDGFSFANIIFFSIQIFCNILFGIISLVSLPFINREK